MNLTQIKAKTESRDVGVVAKRLKFAYAGHIIREHVNKWNRILTTWLPHASKRRRGKPSTRWEVKITKLFGSNWKVKARDRPVWRDLVVANTQS